MPPTTTPYTVPKWNPQTGEGSLTYLSNKTGVPIADILKTNVGNQGIYYQGTDPRLREGAVLNLTSGTTPAPGATSPVGPGIASTTEYRNNLNQTTTKLDEFANDPYLALFQQARGAGRSGEEAERLQARATSAKFEKGAISEADRYKAGLETAGIMRGLSQYAPGLQADKLAQAESNLQAKLFEIDQEEKLALAKAKQARTENDLSIMQEQLDYVQGLRKAKADALSEANKLAYEREKFEKEYALALRREDRLSRVATEGSGSAGGEVIEGTGAESGDIGLIWLYSQPDVTQEEIDLYNSDANFQRRVLDQASAIYGGSAIKFNAPAKSEPKISGRTSDFTKAERRKLEQAGLLGATRQEMLDHLYEKTGGGPGGIPGFEDL